MTPDAPIEAYLDELLRRTRADARTTRRLLAEAADHLYATAADLADEGMDRGKAEIEAVRRFGPVAPVVRATLRRSLRGLVGQTLRAATFLSACGLVAVGVSGLIALFMNVAFGRSFVGGAAMGPGAAGPSVQEVADDAVALRVFAGLAGLVVLLGYWAWCRARPVEAVLPAGLVDALGAAAFAAATAGLAIMATEQARQTGSPGVGFALSGAVVTLPAAALFCTRSASRLLPRRS